ncbi:CPBP family intramembrane glutamic endopeptidase [uncultured Pseudokineococcus sp.]|uniref:CPBP family intramembrane glutamic endopeptidase n=1 Tax=uncultured Pseudokineococcus sp. TaxID=1642928 RepID=UPI0026062E74|nr:CPBP family intramembrane glutamic endopeptidase [uncultured Pseudokineococcus sp.]
MTPSPADAPTSSPRSRSLPGLAVLVVGLLLLSLSVAWLAASGHTSVRYRADSAETVEVWRRWVPALAGIAVVRLLPVRGRPAVVGSSSEPAARREGLVLVAIAVVFAVGLHAAGGGEPAHTAGKLALLVALPLLVLRRRRRRGTAWRAAVVTGSRRWRLAGPVVALLAWGLLAFASPLAMPGGDLASTVTLAELVATVVVGFLVNAVVEEVFYRRWLLSRVQAWLGPWPAIVLSSLLWSVWHAAIQGTGDLGLDVPSALVTHMPLGVFLGCLWSRYRRMWPLLAAHGAVNSLGLFVGT